MKKQKIKALKLNKKSISNFNSSSIHGGSGACGIESVIICEAPNTDTCSINNVACNTGSGSRPTYTCPTEVPTDCNVNTGTGDGTPSIFPVVC
jgi:hypothetical protein